MRHHPPRRLREDPRFESALAAEAEAAHAYDLSALRRRTLGSAASAGPPGGARLAGVGFLAGSVLLGAIAYVLFPPSISGPPARVGTKTAPGVALEGTALEASALEASALEGTALEGTALEGTALEGTALEASALEGSTLEGHASEGSPSQGTASRGSPSEGSPSQGTASGGTTREEVVPPRPVPREAERPEGREPSRRPGPGAAHPRPRRGAPVRSKGSGEQGTPSAQGRAAQEPPERRSPAPLPEAEAAPGDLTKPLMPSDPGHVYPTLPSDLAEDLAEYDEARSALESGRLELAARAFRAYLERRPHGRLRFEARLALVEALVRLERPSEALPLAEDLLVDPQAASRRAEILRLVVELQIATGDCESARARVLQSFPELLDMMERCVQGGG